MLGAPQRSLASLIGSIGLHACALLTFVVALRRAPPPATSPERADAWVGNAVEVEQFDGDEAPSAQSTAAHESASESAPESAPPAPGLAPETPTAADAVNRVPEKPRPRPAPPHATTMPQAVAQRKPPTKKQAATPPTVRSDEHPGALESANSGNGGGVVGAQGLPPGVRSLPSAFTRAIPAAVSGDPLWQTLPLGAQSAFTIAVELEEGKLASATISMPKPGSAVPTEVTHLRDRVLSLLGGGGFALSSDSRQSGRDVLRIQVTLSQRGAEDEDDPARLVERGFEPPQGSAPGRAYFTLASGRHFEARVEILSTRAAH